MGAVFFYHLTRRPLEATLPVLLDRSRANGWRVVVRGTDPGRMSWLDEKLWMGKDDGFLPHGLSGGPHDALQPILLTTDHNTSAQCLMCIDGAAPRPEEVSASERVCILFDGTDPEAVQTARGHWKALTDAGCAAQYWSEADGKWEKKAEAGG
ncbi:MAG: DNA polymerase III subunit chi [Aliishimia sp.]